MSERLFSFSLSLSLFLSFSFFKFNLHLTLNATDSLRAHIKAKSGSLSFSFLSSLLFDHFCKFSYIYLLYKLFSISREINYTGHASQRECDDED